MGHRRRYSAFQGLQSLGVESLKLLQREKEFLLKSALQIPSNQKILRHVIGLRGADKALRAPLSMGLFM